MPKVPDEVIALAKQLKKAFGDLDEIKLKLGALKFDEPPKEPEKKEKTWLEEFWEGKA